MPRDVPKSALIVGTIAGLSQWFVVSRCALATVGDQFLLFLWWDVRVSPYSWLIPLAGAATIAPCVLALGYTAARHLDRVSHGEARSSWTFGFWGTTIASFAYPVYGFLRALSPDSLWTADLWPWTIVIHVGVLTVCGGLCTWMLMARTRPTFWKAFSCYWSWCCVSFLMFVNNAPDFL